jgi:predicted alpha/beta-hydrolase family hydrolase
LPDKAPVLEACFGAVVQAARARATSGRPRLVIGGKSMGGRMATHLGAADAIPGLAGIVALGYPLHPPGKPQQLRAAHLPHIAVPVLLVQGERDTFGGPSELQPVIETMRAPVTLHVMPGGDHSFVSRAAPCGAVYEVILDVMVAWIERLDA